MSPLNPGGNDVVNRPEQGFPLDRQILTKLYLSPETLQLTDACAEEKSSIEFDSNSGSVAFTYTLPSRTELAGYFTAHLFVEAIDSSDLDLFVK